MAKLFSHGACGREMTQFLTVTANRWGEKQGSLPRGLVKLSLSSLEEIKPRLPRWKPICCYAFSVHLADPLQRLNEDHSCYLCCVQRLSRRRGKRTKENNPARWLHLQLGWMVADVSCIHTALEEEECFSLTQSFAFGSDPLYNHVHIVTKYGTLPSSLWTRQRCFPAAYRWPNTSEALQIWVPGSLQPHRDFLLSNFFSIVTAANTHKPSHFGLGYHLSLFLTDL